MDEVGYGDTSPPQLSPLYIAHGRMGRHDNLSRPQHSGFSSQNIYPNQGLVKIPDRHHYIGQVQLQFAKLKYAMGESTTALKVIEDGIPSPCFQLDGEHLKSFIVKSTHESVEIVGRRILQSTEWMVSDGLKSKSEISNRYRTVLELAPNWERGVYGVLNYFLITTSRSLC